MVVLWLKKGWSKFGCLTLYILICLNEICINSNSTCLSELWMSIMDIFVIIGALMVHTVNVRR